MNTHIRTYVSVDCIVLGFDGEQLNVLLIKKENQNISPKLPGHIIDNDEDINDAASRILRELTGIKGIAQRQFRCFASPSRVKNKEDMAWIDIAYQSDINRFITMAYLSIFRIDRKLNNAPRCKGIDWLPINQVPNLSFDHNQIIEESVEEIRKWIETDPAIIFDLLPAKFVISQMHKLYEAIYAKKIDIRNFHKKIQSLPYLKSLEEKQTNVPHRAANYYKFNRSAYNKYKASI